MLPARPRPPRRTPPRASTPRAPRTRAAALAASAAALLAAACAGDTAPAPPTAPPAPGAPAAPTTPTAPTAPTTPTTPGAPPTAPTGARGERAELDALYGAAAPSVAGAITARRQAADSLLAADAVGLANEELAAAAPAPAAAGPGLAARSAAPRAALAREPREVVTREVVTADGRTFRIDTRAVHRPAFDRASATLRITQDFMVAVTPEGAAGRAYRTESTYAFDLPACPAADGTSSGRLLVTSRSWHRTNAPAGEGADSATADRRRETRVDGEVLLRVDDAADLAAVDLTLNVGAAWDNGTGAPLRGAGRLTWPGAPADVFAQPYDPARISGKTGDLDALDALGYGPGDRYGVAMDLAARQVQAARALWRGGRCVEVALVRGHTDRFVLPGSTVEFGPEARSRVDRTTVAPATFLARAEGGSISPLVPVPHPATFRFTMPDAPVLVEFRAASRRGIGTLRLPFLRAIPDTATITYAATSSYLFARYAPRGGGSMTDSITGRMEVASRVRFAFDRTEGDATYYKVLADSRIVVAGRGSVTAQAGRETVKWELTLAGDDSTHNPRQPGDAPLVQGRTVSPEDFRPSTEAGTLKVTQRNLVYAYELHLRVGQITPTFTQSSVGRTACAAGGTAEFRTSYDNRTRVTTESNTPGTNAQGTTCSYPGPAGSWTRTDAAPLTWGAIFFDRSQRAPGNDIGALVRGTWVVGEPTPAGKETGLVTGCEKVRIADPTQLGTKFAAFGQGPPSELDYDWDEGGVTCRLQYSISWKLPLP